MSNQISGVPFGTDATVLAGWAVTAGPALGNIDFVVENTGTNTLTFQFKTLTTYGSYTPVTTSVGAWFTVAPSGVVTKSLCLVSTTLGFFGSGNTTANITQNLRNPADLRGAGIDMFVTGKRGWNSTNNNSTTGGGGGFDTAYNTNANEPVWPVISNS